MEYLINLYAFFLPLFIFTFWGIFGYALLSLFHTQRNVLQNLLLAPTVGFAMSVISTYWLSTKGIPIRDFALVLTTLLLLISLGILFWQKPLFPYKIYSPFAVLFCFALFLTGSPLLMYGFDWISFSNGDMANYCLGATRFLNHGYYDFPDGQALLLGTDFSLFNWFLNVASMARSGSEISLAWVAGMTHLNTLQIFMPLILAFHLSLISIAGAMVCFGKNKKIIALITCLLVTFSSLTTLGTLYQLIAQVAGLSLLCASVIFIMQPFLIHKKYYFILQSVLITIIISAFTIVYPELTPFLGGPIILYFCFYYLKGRRLNRNFYLTVVYSIFFTLFFLNKYLFSFFSYLVRQLTCTTQLSTSSAFPYFLLPSGLANFWGLLPMNLYFFEPITSTMIILGALLFIFTIIATLRLMWSRILPLSFVALVMMFIAILFFFKEYGYALFKLSLYAQPFILGIFTITLFEWIKSKRIRVTILASFLLLNFACINYFVYRSKAVTPGSFTEISYASNMKINREYTHLLQKIPSDAILLSDDFNLSLLRFVAMQSHPHRFIFFTSPTLFYVLSRSDPKWLEKFKIKSLYDRMSFSKQTRYYINLIQKIVKLNQFDLKNPYSPKMEFFHSYFNGSMQQFATNSFLVSDSELRNSLNRYHYPNSSKSNFILQNFSEIKNHLVFVDSSLGRVYYSYLNSFTSKMDDKSRTFFNLESDLYFPKKTTQALGRYLLFRVLKPTQKFRLVFAVTNTLTGDGINKIPNAAVIGDTNNSLPIIGRGSARVISSSFSPQIIDGVPYVAIDMNREGKVYPYKRKGLMRLYGRNIIHDPRYIVTHSRDISLISEEEYHKFNSPQYIKDFPRDLGNPSLEYSGVYEDSWISEDAFFVLKQPTLNNDLIIEGMLPRISKLFTNTTLILLIDGKKIFQKNLGAGEFNLKIPVHAQQIGPKKIELHFSSLQKLPNGDNRPVTARIYFIGFA